MTRSKPRVTCKVYFSLLLLSYLEIVLWTSCLFASAAPVLANSYLLRETGNLKYAGSQVRPPVEAHVPLLVEALRCVEQALECERAALQALQLARDVPQTSDLLQPGLGELRNLLSGVKGTSPAPWTGIAAID